MTPPPLPTAGPDDDGVIVTGERSKLPADVAALTEAGLPLPPDVQLFEKRITLRDAFLAAVWSVGLAGIGFFCLIFGVAVLIHPTGPVTVSSQADWVPLGFGLVCLLAAWMMAGTALARLRIRAEQRAGRPTRVGIALTPAALIELGETTWCVLPKASVRGVTDGKVTYVVKGQEKTLTLPGELVAGDARAMSPAIARWLDDRA